MNSREDDIKKLIAEHNRRLQKLKEKQARMGISTPPEILTEIEDIEVEIRQLAAELGDTGATSPTSLDVISSPARITPEESASQSRVAQDQIRPAVSSPAPELRQKLLSSVTLASVLGVCVFLLLVGTIFVVIYQSSIVSMPETTPTSLPKMTGSFRVAVPGFVEQNGGTSEKGNELAQEVAQRLQNRFDEMSGHPGVTVWGPDQVGSIASQTYDEIADSAKQLAQDIEADVVVYGIIDTTENQVIPKFEFGTDRFEQFYELEEIISEQAIGAPLPISTAGDFLDRDSASRKLSIEVQILSNILYGLGYYYTSEPDYQEALARFQAADIEEWPEAQGKHVLYVLLGNAAGKTGDLAQAEAYYQKSKAIKPDYANAFLGLANVYLNVAIKQFRDTSNPNDIEVNLLDQAIQTYKEAKEVAVYSPSPDLATRVAFSLGECYLIRATADEASEAEYYENALEEFKSVIIDYAGGSRPRLKGLAAEAHARIGLMYLDENDNCALKEYETALSLLSESNPRRATYEDQVNQLKGHADASQCLPDK